MLVHSELLSMPFTVCFPSPLSLLKLFQARTKNAICRKSVNRGVHGSFVHCGNIAIKTINSSIIQMVETCIMNLEFRSLNHEMYYESSVKFLIALANLNVVVGMF